MKRILTVLAAVVGLGAAAGMLVVHAQSRTVWDGVYTEAQAKRGGELYGQRCATCHGADLRGADVAPGLMGEEFAEKWEDQPLAPMFELMRVTMPQDAPGSLSRSQTADILAFVLSKAGFPQGDQELAFNTDALGQITFVSKKP